MKRVGIRTLPMPLGAAVGVQKRCQPDSERRNTEDLIALRRTTADGTDVDSEPCSSQDVMASVCKALGVSLETKFTSRNGRPMIIANSGKVIPE